MNTLNSYEDIYGGVIFTPEMAFAEDHRIRQLGAQAAAAEADRQAEIRRKATADQIMRTGLVPQPNHKINLLAPNLGLA